ncbi:MAG TPA: LysM peptidoglycan-binding domain-containing protein [Bacillota bacterium]|nr:LysM peptidoglycan-binding domain-containing protein [Bacillota bacterium]
MQLKKVSLSLLALLVLSICCAGIVWGQTYYVQPGDSLYSIATRYGTTVSALQTANGLRSGIIYPGQALNISSVPGPAPAPSSNYYTVRSGDTLFLLAQKFGVTVSDLKRSNNLYSDYLTVGKTLVIPVSAPSQSGSSYQVQYGDTLYLIANRYGISVNTLKAANGIYGNEIRPGQTLKIPAPGNSSGSNSNPYLSQTDLDLLARLVSAEAGGESFEGQVAVAATILNRLQDPRYPKTVPGIIYQVDNGSYQYSPVLDGRINLPASSSAYQAVQSAISGWDPSRGANGFYNPDKTVNQWVRSQPVTAVIGNHIFFSY